MAKQTFTTGQVLTAAQMTSLQQTAMGGGAATAKTTSYVLTAADAGTVVQMNAAGATTITVNTALFAAGDSVQIQNIGAGVCTITAGTATVTTAGSLALSQWEGGNLYFTSTSASIFFDIVQSSGMTNPMTTTGDTIYSSSGSTPARLGIGTANQVLTVNAGATAPEWKTPTASGMAWTLLNSGGTALTGAQTITVSGISGANQVMVVFVSASAVNSSDTLAVRINTDTTTKYNSYGTYVYSPAAYVSGGISQNITSTGGTYIPVGIMSGSAGSAASGYCLITGANSTGTKMFQSLAGFSRDGNDSQQNYILGGYYTGASVVSSISMFAVGSNFDAGTVYVYTTA